MTSTRPIPTAAAKPAQSIRTADRVERRTRTWLVVAQVASGVAVWSGVGVGTLLALELSGSAALAGLETGFAVAGAAIIAIPMTRLTARSGRRPALLLGYGLALLGAVGMIVAGVTRSFPVLLASALLLGGAAASSGQARYAATDLATPTRAGRAVGLVVWASTAGAVVGPSLADPGVRLGTRLGLPPLAGPFLFYAMGLLLALAALAYGLRPDPLLEARRRRSTPSAENPPATPNRARGSVITGLRVVLTRPRAALGFAAMGVGHVTMVAVMVMTPLHMADGDASFGHIGLVLSTHALGMYAVAPLTGYAVDRLGSRAVVLTGAAMLALAALLAGTAPAGHSALLTVALLLLGLGWSCTLVAGSALLNEGVAFEERPAAQGASDLVNSVVGGSAAALAGTVMDASGFTTMAFVCLAPPLVLAASGLVLRGHPSMRTVRSAS